MGRIEVAEEFLPAPDGLVLEEEVFRAFVWLEHRRATLIDRLAASGCG
jgi:hypothetical protein